MDLKIILQQSELAREAMTQMNIQNRIFETEIQKALEGAPDSDKKKIEEVKTLMNTVINLTKEGKTTEAQNLIKNFQNGGKNS